MGYTRDENGLFMRGRLIEPLTAEHEAYGETLYLGKIEIMRLSGTADTLPITVPGRLMKGFRIGDTIEFNGELRSYNRHVDGANRLQQIRYITLPAISGIVAVMLILSVGRILDDNFEQILNMYSPAVYEVSDVFETYIYRSGIVDGNFSYTAAVGLFKSFIALLLIWGTDRVTKKLGSDGLF